MRRGRGLLWFAVALLVVLAILISRPGAPIPVVTALPTGTRTSTATPIASATSTLTPSTTPSPTETLSPTPTDTDTVVPSITPSDTLTVTPTVTSTEDSRVILQVVPKIAVFRTGPGKVYPVVAQLKQGNQIVLSGINADRDWYMFIYKGKNAWISGDKLVSQIIFGDVNTLPVIEAPPTPIAQPTEILTGSDDGGVNASTCDFDNNMSPEAQNALLATVYAAVDANDWHEAGRLARQLYACTVKPVFYLLHDVYLPTHINPANPPPDAATAFTQFQNGWLGR